MVPRHVSMIQEHVVTYISFNYAPVVGCCELRRVPGRRIMTFFKDGIKRLGVFEQRKLIFFGHVIRANSFT